MKSSENYSSIIFSSSKREFLLSSFIRCLPFKRVNDNFFNSLEFSFIENVETSLVLLGVSSAVRPALPKGSLPVLAWSVPYLLNLIGGLPGSFSSYPSGTSLIVLSLLVALLPLF